MLLIRSVVICCRLALRFFCFCRVFRELFHYTAVSRLAVELDDFLDKLTFDKIESRIIRLIIIFPFALDTLR